MRCLGPARPILTPALAPERWSPIMQIQIRQWAPQLFCSTPRAQETAPLEQPPWSITTMVLTIRLWVRSRCKPTPTEAIILRWATPHFKIAPAITLPPWALTRVPIQISLATISISAIPVFPAMTNVISIGGIAASGTPYELTFIGGIYGSEVNTGSALPVYVDTDGHLGTTLVNASGQKLRMRGPQGAQHQATLNEFQKQQKRIAELENTVARLAATVKDQAAQIEKVSAQLELRKPAGQVVANKR